LETYANGSSDTTTDVMPKNNDITVDNYLQKVTQTGSDKFAFQPIPYEL
jgi:hypothetical protein